MLWLNRTFPIQSVKITGTLTFLQVKSKSTLDTVQLMLSPYNVARNDTVTTVIYPRALESGTYQLLTSMSGFRQQVDDTVRTVGFNVTVRSMNVT